MADHRPGTSTAQTTQERRIHLAGALLGDPVAAAGQDVRRSDGRVERGQRGEELVHPRRTRRPGPDRRWLDVRAGITAQLEGSDPGYLWIPTKPGRARDGIEPPKPGLTRAAVRTLHAAHRTLVLQVFGAPLRPGALLPH